MSNNKAIVTLVIGDEYKSIFEDCCRRWWEAYANRNGYDIIVIESVLDNSERAKSRSPAWQKCLIFEDERVQKYDRIVWVDADIILNPEAPCICENVPAKAVGAVDSYGYPNPEIYNNNLSQLYKSWDDAGISYIINLTPLEYHKNWGLTDLSDVHKTMVVQTGVLVLSPYHHAETLRHVYDNYEDKGGAEWNYEMRPLSYELLQKHHVHKLDYRFNSIVNGLMNHDYPFLAKDIFKDMQSSLTEEQKNEANFIVLKKCIETMLNNSFFLHFAGCQNLIKLFR